MHHLNWTETIEYIKQIPYGRNSNREDFSLVISEKKGTCSSKHAYLKDFATKNNIPNVQLIIGIYKMNEQNTKIGKILSDNKIKYIPEAHCYLKINGKTIDVTSLQANLDSIKADLLQEIEIEPFQVVDFKINYHQNFIKSWLKETRSKHSFNEIWTIREQCIAYLSNDLK